MIGPIEIGLSRALIGKTRMRLEHQRRIVAKLGFTGKPQHVETALGVLFTMEAELTTTIERHEGLLLQVHRTPTCKQS